MTVHEQLMEKGAERVPLDTVELLGPVEGMAAGRYGVAGSSYPSANRSSRGGRAVTGVVIHTAEGITDAWKLGAFFAPASRGASSHDGADDDKTVRYVPYEYAAWTLRNGNPWTDNLELCGFASWTREQWLAHPGMLQQAGEWIGERCRARGVPIVKLSPEQIARGERRGVFAHWDYTKATGDGTHWDVGTGFPWDVVLAIARGESAAPAPSRTNLEDAMMDARRNSETGTIYLTHPSGKWWGVPSPAYLTLAVARQVTQLPAIEMSWPELRWLAQVYGLPADAFGASADGATPRSLMGAGPLFGLEEDQVLAILEAEGIPLLTDEQIRGLAPAAG